MSNQAFNKWAAKIDWWGSDSKDRMEAVWTRLSELGVPKDEIADLLREVMSVMKTEYGD